MYVQLKRNEHLSQINLKDTAGLIGKCRKINMINPGFKFDFCKDGPVRIRSLYFKKEIEKLNKSIVRNPNDAEALLKRGNLSTYLQDYKKALADYTKVIQRDSMNVDAYYNRAVTKYKLTDFIGAIADYTWQSRSIRRMRMLFSTGDYF